MEIEVKLEDDLIFEIDSRFEDIIITKPNRFTERIAAGKFLAIAEIIKTTIENNNSKSPRGGCLS